MAKTMTLRKSVPLVAALLVAVSTLSAFQATPVDLTGVWTGTLYRSDGGSSTAYLDLKQKDADLTGSAGPDADRQSAIAHGKVATVEGVTSVTFDATQPNGSVMKFDLRLVEGRLKGKVTVERNGETREGTLDVVREKK
jgi:hypothetical protein